MEASRRKNGGLRPDGEAERSGLEAGVDGGTDTCGLAV
jgi:hypothetical protein